MIFPLSSAGENTPGVFCPFLGFSAQGRDGYGLTKCYRYFEGTGTALQQVKAEKDGTVNLEKRDLIVVYKT